MLLLLTLTRADFETQPYGWCPGTLLNTASDTSVRIEDGSFAYEGSRAHHVVGAGCFMRPNRFFLDISDYDSSITLLHRDRPVDAIPSVDLTAGNHPLCTMDVSF